MNRGNLSGESEGGVHSACPAQVRLLLEYCTQPGHDILGHKQRRASQQVFSPTCLQGSVILAPTWASTLREKGIHSLRTYSLKHGDVSRGGSL